jgi:hypothetical protein
MTQPVEIFELLGLRVHLGWRRRNQRQVEEYAMKFLFEDDTFSFETLRTAGFADYFGADLGEVLATAARITDGDDASWASGMDGHRRAGGRTGRAVTCRRAPGHRAGKPVARV